MIPELSDKAEELLESLLAAAEAGAAVQLAHLPQSQAPETIHELVAAGLVARRDDALALTETGVTEARGVLRRHRLAERLLVDVLDVGEELVHETACRFEHIIRKGIDDRICTLLGHPRVCPHWRPIPVGACCLENRDSVLPVVAPLADLPSGAKGRIAYIHTRERGTLEKLMAMGALPGAEVSVIQTFPSHLFQVGQTQVAVDRQIAESVYIRLEQAIPAWRGRWRRAFRCRRGRR